jgi:hypothetical protein
VPLILRKRGGRKLVITPDGNDAWAPPRARVDNTMVKALARAFRWRKLMESGVYGTVEEIAAAEKIGSDSHLMIFAAGVSLFSAGESATCPRMSGFLHLFRSGWSSKASPGSTGRWC